MKNTWNLKKKQVVLFRKTGDIIQEDFIKKDKQNYRKAGDIIQKDK